MVELRGYIDETGKKRFANWFDGLDAVAAAKVTIALTRMEQGNLFNAKGVGGGVHEYKIDFGPATASISARTGASCDPDRRRQEEAPRQRHCRSAGVLD